MGIKRKEAELVAKENKRIGDGFGIAVRARINRKVICFLGDMSAESGIVHESIKYAVNHDLPVLFVIEDNGLSVSTDTAAVWGRRFGHHLIGPFHPAVAEGLGPYAEGQKCKVLRYCYKLTRPHVGIGQHVAF